MRVDFRPVNLPSGGNIGGLLNQANNSFVSSFDRLATNLNNLDQKNKQKASNALIPQLAGITTQEEADSFLSTVDPRNITPELANHLIGLKSNAQQFQSNALKQDGTRALTANTNAQTDVLRNEDNRIQTTFERKNSFEDALNNLAPQLLGSSLDAADGINGSGTNALRNIDTNGVNIRDLLSIVDGNQGREQRGDSNRDTTRSNQQIFDNNNLVNADANRGRDFTFANAKRDDELAQENLRQAKAGQRAAFNLNATSIDRQAADQAYLNDPTVSPEAKAAYLAQIEAIPATASAPSFESAFANTGLTNDINIAAINAASVQNSEAAAASNDTFRRVANNISANYSDGNPGVTFKNRNPDVAKSKDITGIVNELSRSEEVSPATVYAAIEENFRESRLPFNTKQTFSKSSVRDFIQQFKNPEDTAIAAEKNRISEINVSKAQAVEQSLRLLSDRIRRAEDLGQDTTELRKIFTQQRNSLGNE